DWWLTGYGPAGLASFKIGVVLLVGSLAAAVSQHRPLMGGRVLTFACTALAGGFLYSCSLGWVGRAGPPPPDPARGAAERRCLDRQLKAANRYRALAKRLAEDLGARRRTLVDAVARLAATERGRDPAWLRLLRAEYPHLPHHRACLAADL